MEDIVEEEEEEPVMDIDGRDKKNPLAVVDYIEDIYANYRRTEVINFSSSIFSMKWKKKGKYKNWGEKRN